jgi:hypothetical protein
MRPKYFILGSDKVLGNVYVIGDRTIIFMNDPVINMQDGMRFMTNLGQKVEDKDVEEILNGFIFHKPLTESE